MSHLLRIHKISAKAVQQGKIPLIMEFPVHPNTAPYLVSTYDAVKWIPAAFPGNIVKAAVRKVKPEDLYLEVLPLIRDMSQELGWESVSDLSEAGIRAAIDHLRFYELTDLVVLAHPDILMPESSVDITEVVKEHGYLVQPCSWLPQDCVVVVPKDRDFLGFVGLLGVGKVVMLVHNASRGIALAWGKQEAGSPVNG